MQPNSILQADLLDILFENRNKSYGAYALRKNYSGQLRRAMAVTFATAALIAVLALTAKQDVPVSYVFTKEGTVLAPPPAPEAPKPPKKTPAPPSGKTASTQTFTNNIVVTGNPVPRINNLIDSLRIGTRTVLTAGPRIVDPYPPVDIPLPSAPVTAPAPSVDRDKPLLTADVMPVFPGGPDALRKFLQKNLTTPDGLEAGIEADVRIRFVVGYDGHLKSFETVEDGGAIFNNEVVRVLKKMPRWIPGKASGENVSVYYTLPVKFAVTE